MYKPASLRAAIVAAAPDLDDQERLVLLVTNGGIVCRPSGLSFEYRYQLELNVLDYPHHPELLMVTVLDWLRTHQPEILQKPPAEASRDFNFEADFLNNGAIDISIKLQLTENVRIQRDGATQTITHLSEPVADFGNIAEEWLFYVMGELVGSYRKISQDAPATTIPAEELPAP